MAKTIWVYWENLGRASIEPPHITLCRWTMLYRLRDCSLCILTPENIEKYVPGIKSKVKNLQVDVKGRVDRWGRKLFGQKRKNVAVSCDIYRANILKEHGGIYVDSDCIFLDDMSGYFSALDHFDFQVVRRDSHGKKHCPVNFMGSNRNGRLISEYVAAQDELLSKRSEVSYNELGAGLLTQVIDRNPLGVKIYDEAESMPITFEEFYRFAAPASTTSSESISDNQRLVMLFNDIFDTELAQCDVKALYHHPSLIGDVFRRALPLYEFEKMYDAHKI